MTIDERNPVRKGKDKRRDVEQFFKCSEKTPAVEGGCFRDISEQNREREERERKREINLRREIRKSGGAGPLLVRQDSIVSRATAINVFQTRPPVPRARRVKYIHCCCSN